MDPLLQALMTAGVIDAELANQLNRQTDPAAARLWAEEMLFVAAQSGLSAQQQRLLALLEGTGYQPSAPALAAFWQAENERLGRALLPALREVASERAAIDAARVAAATGRDVASTFALVNRQVLAWVDDYYINADADPAKLGSLPSLNLTARTRFGQAFAEWNRGELERGRPTGLPQLIDALTPAFGATRAEAIATTEVTRVFTESMILAEHENEYTVAYRWLTAADELVCPLCSPRSNRVYSKQDVESGAVERPPIHTRDRCQLTPETSETLRVPVRRSQRVIASAGFAIEVPTEAPRQSTPTPAAPPVVTPPQPATLRTTMPADANAEPLLRQMERTLAGVHTLPAGLPPVPLRMGVAQENAVGAYIIDQTKRRPDMIMIRPGARNEFTAWHEFGHYLDHQHFQISDQVRGLAQRPPAVSDELRAEFWQAVNATTQVSKMRERYNQLTQASGGGANATDAERLLGYYLRQDEIWARAYSQFVARKSGQMREDYEKDLSQWRDADFAPVERIIGKMLDAAGMGVK